LSQETEEEREIRNSERFCPGRNGAKKDMVPTIRALFRNSLGGSLWRVARRML
jgi:hypothetical protein